MSLARQLFNKLRFAKNNASIINVGAKVLPAVFNVSQRFYSNAPTPYEVVKPDEENVAAQEIFHNVNALVTSKKEGRLFAVVQVAGKQFKITEGDVIVIEGYWPPTVGDKITLDKVLLVGAENFTLIGKPLIQTGLAKVLSTVIEKTISHTKTHFRKKRRKQYMRINFYRVQQTMLRINNIEITGEVNKPPEVSDVKSRSF